MSTLFIVQQCHVYRVPARTSTAGYRAAEWGDTAAPLWTGRLRVLEHAETCEIRLEDANSGELFASAPYDVTGKSVEAVLDSSRYFVIRVESDDHGTKRHAYIGVGFVERSESFDFTVALQDWTRRRKSELAGGKGHTENGPSPHLPSGPRQNFALTEGETMHIKMPGGAQQRAHVDQPRASPGFVLPPPPPPSSSRNK